MSVSNCRLAGVALIPCELEKLERDSNYELYRRCAYLKDERNLFYLTSACTAIALTGVFLSDPNHPTDRYMYKIVTGITFSAALYAGQKLYDGAKQFQRDFNGLRG